MHVYLFSSSVACSFLVFKLYSSVSKIYTLEVKNNYQDKQIFIHNCHYHAYREKKRFLIVVLF